MLDDQKYTDAPCLRMLFVLEGEHDPGRMVAQGRAFSTPRIGEAVLLNATINGEGEQVGVYRVVDVIHVYDVITDEQISVWEERFEAGVVDRFVAPLCNSITVVVRYLGKGNALTLLNG